MNSDGMYGPMTKADPVRERSWLGIKLNQFIYFMVFLILELMAGAIVGHKRIYTHNFMQEPFLVSISTGIVLTPLVISIVVAWIHYNLINDAKQLPYGKGNTLEVWLASLLGILAGFIIWVSVVGIILYG